MSNPFVLLYKLFESRRTLFYALLFLLAAGIVLLASRLSLKEDITAFIPKDEKTRKSQEVIKNLKINDRLIVNIFLKDTTRLDPDLLTEYADALADSLQSHYDSTWIKEIRYKVGDEMALNVFDLLYADLPYYLDQEDYEKIDRGLSDSVLYKKIKSNYETIVSTEGIALKNYLIKDPLGLNTYALNKLARLQSDENFELYNGYFLTKNHKNLFLYLSVAYPPNDSEKNTVLVQGLTGIITNLDTAEYKSIQAEYFGAPAIAVSNVTQIKNDSIFTSTFALVVIFLALALYFRNVKTILLIFLPVVFGIGFSLALIYLFKQEISAIAIGAGSIVIGIAMDYSLHFFTHLKHERSVKKVIADLTLPLTLGCTTTVGAFLCLNYMQSEALRDMGLFAALTLAGAAFCCLIILPQLSRSFEKKTDIIREYKTLDRFTSYPFHKNKLFQFLIVVLTIVFTFFYDKVGFETDMTKLGNVSPALQKAEDNLDRISNYKLKSVFLVSQGKTLEEALLHNASAVPGVQKLVKANKIKKYSNIGDLLLSESTKKEKIAEWKKFWTPEKIQHLQTKLYQYGSEFHFKEAAFEPTLSLLQKEFNPADTNASSQLKNIFLDEYINQTSQGTSVITILKVTQEDKPVIYKAFEDLKEVYVVDRGSMVAMFAKILNDDFNLILVLCSALVFGFLLLSYGRFELAFLTFLPMIISWIWILGIMGITGIKFNIINIILCTFIFGLGDDYSIFTLDGLEQEYKYGRNVLASYRNSIFLSAFTTLVGIGVLIFASHPALKSIALVTIIGIFTIVFVSLVVQPFLYELFVLGRKRKGQLPITLYVLIMAVILVVYFILGVILLRISALFSTENKTTKRTLTFNSSLSSLLLYTERKFGDALAIGFVKKYIDWIPFGTVVYFENSYLEKRRLLSGTDYFRGKLINNYIFKGPVLEWYTRIKIGLENNYKVFDELVPSKGKIVDVGCGYGYLSYMLSLTSPEREITGIDYDEEKIEIANNGILRTDQLNFFHSDVLSYEYSKSDVFIISDVLHYLKEESQIILIRKCLDNLNDGGMLIIRDGNSELKDRHKGTKLTEFFSTKVIGFNKVTIDKLCFTSKEKILSAVSDYKVSVETLDNTQFTSNIIFIIRKNNA